MILCFFVYYTCLPFGSQPKRSSDWTSLSGFFSRWTVLPACLRAARGSHFLRRRARSAGSAANIPAERSDIPTGQRKFL